jgi:hypothetical protein
VLAPCPTIKSDLTGIVEQCQHSGAALLIKKNSASTVFGRSAAALVDFAVMNFSIYELPKSTENFICAFAK